MDLFFAMCGILMSVALARLYAKYELRSLITSLLLLILSIFIMEFFKH